MNRLSGRHITVILSDAQADIVLSEVFNNAISLDKI